MTTLPQTTPGLQRPGLFLKLAMWWGPRPLLQVGLLLLGSLFIALVVATVSGNLARIGVTPGFDFLSRSANFEIGEQVIGFSAGDTYLRALLVGLLNTLKVAVLGCLLATFLGVAIGVAGLSGNPLLGALVRGYIEIIRNTPLLLQLFLWISLAQSLPPPRRALSLFDTVFLSNRGIFLPGPVFEGGGDIALLAVGLIIAATFAGVFIGWQRDFLNLRRIALLFFATLLLIASALWLSGVRTSFDVPALTGFNIRGGYSVTPEFAALLIGLVVKFSASIAEIVRAGILSVKQGQWEAGRALGLTNGQIMRLVVLPQALRVITPLTTSNYLDLTKDSSLAVAIGYPDLVSISNTTANTTGQAFEALLILVSVYVVLNLAVALLMNRYNNRVALRGGKPA